MIRIPEMFNLFPECVARAPVSLWGVGGWGCVRSTLRLRSQPFATVRGRSREVRMAVPIMASSAKGCTFGGFKRHVASFRVAGVALCDIQTCFITCQKYSKVVLCGRRNTFAMFSHDKLRFLMAGAALETPIVILRGRRRTSDVSRCVLFANTIVRAASRADNVQNLWQAWHVVTCDDTPHSTLYTPHCTLYTLHTLHFTLHTLHSTLYTSHFTLYTLDFTLCTPHSTLYTLHSTHYTPHSTLHTLHFTLRTPHSTLYTPHFTLNTCTLHSTLYTPHSTLHSTLYTSHFIYTLHSRLYTLHSTLYTLHSTLHTLHSTLYTLHSALSSLHSTLHMPQFTLYTPHSRLYTPTSTLCTPPSSGSHGLQCTGTVTREKCTRLFK